MNETLTYTNPFSELFAPLLVLIRSTGFFEAHVYMPLMTMAALLLFFQLHFVTHNNGTFDEPIRAKYPKVWLFAYFTLCFIVTNAIAVAFKTMIFEETDYTTFFWYVPWVSPLHFYIVSIAGVMLWLIWRNRATWMDKLACVYVQCGFLGGYYIAIYRLLNEPFDLLDPTSGVSGIFLCCWFGILNWDIIIRYLKVSYEHLAVNNNKCSRAE